MTLFEDRKHAGKILADTMAEIRLPLKNPFVLSIPRGGVPIGSEIARILHAPLDVLVLRKLPLPQNDQMGFGAVTLDRTVILNHDVVRRFFITDGVIDAVTDEVYDEVLRRNEIYRGGRDFPPVKDRSVVITDDGLATGYTMLAAVESVKARQPWEVIVSVPVASQNAYKIIGEAADRVVCLHVATGLSFAVASFYEEFPDLRDSEVKEILNRSQVL